MRRCRTGQGLPVHVVSAGLERHCSGVLAMLSRVGVGGGRNHTVHPPSETGSYCNAESSYSQAYSRERKIVTFSCPRAYLPRLIAPDRHAVSIIYTTWPVMSHTRHMCVEFFFGVNTIGPRVGCANQTHYGISALAMHALGQAVLSRS